MEELDNIKKQIENGNIIIDKLKNKEFKLYFFVLDTKGNPSAGIANIYEHVKVLNKLNYNAVILHEKNDYKFKTDENGMGLEEWLGEEYGRLPHESIENKQLNIQPEDFILIPEIFSNVMEQIKTFPCKKIVFSQNYGYLLDILPVGKNWVVDYGFNDAITTSEKQAEYLRSLFPLLKTHIVPVSIPSYFKPTDKPKKPVVGILSRNQTDTTRIVKSFYLQYPQYKWVTFRDLRGIPREQFAKELSEYCVAVWIDDLSGFGTFPVECFETETPIIGKIPELIPEWLEEKTQTTELILKENSGIWTTTNLAIPELIAMFMKAWLEDSVPQETIDGMLACKGQYTEEKQITKLSEVYETLLIDRINAVKLIVDKLEEKVLNVTE